MKDETSLRDAHLLVTSLVNFVETVLACARDDSVHGFFGEEYLREFDPDDDDAPLPPSAHFARKADRHIRAWIAVGRYRETLAAASFETASWCGLVAESAHKVALQFTSRFFNAAAQSAHGRDPVVGYQGEFTFQEAATLSIADADMGSVRQGLLKVLDNITHTDFESLRAMLHKEWALVAAAQGTLDSSYLQFQQLFGIEACNGQTGDGKQSDRRTADREMDNEPAAGVSSGPREGGPTTTEQLGPVEFYDRMQEVVQAANVLNSAVWDLISTEQYVLIANAEILGLDITPAAVADQFKAPDERLRTPIREATLKLDALLEDREFMDFEQQFTEWTDHQVRWAPHRPESTFSLMRGIIHQLVVDMGLGRTSDPEFWWKVGQHCNLITGDLRSITEALESVSELQTDLYRRARENLLGQRMQKGAGDQTDQARGTGRRQYFLLADVGGGEGRVFDCVECLSASEMEMLKSTVGPEIQERFGTLTIVDAEEASRNDPALYLRVCREWRELGELIMEALPPPFFELIELMAVCCQYSVSRRH